MKINLVLFMLLFSAAYGHGQKLIRDRHITHQQERMVFKQWDRKKFTPASGFLGLNPMYWLTWGLHPNYPKTDLRPLGPYGPQVQRLGLTAVMQQTENAYKLHADTLRHTAMSEAVNYSGLFAPADPLWLLYYKKQFESLLEPSVQEVLKGLSPAGASYLMESGDYQWYRQECDMLSERLRAAISTTIDRGSRIMVYHRLLQEYRKLCAVWESRKLTASGMLATKEQTIRLRGGKVRIPPRSGRTDIQIADGILSRSKL